MTEQVLDENKLIAERRAKLEHVRQGCPANGHPNTFRRSHKAAELQAQFADKSKEELESLASTPPLPVGLWPSVAPSWFCRTYPVAFRPMPAKKYRLI